MPGKNASWECPKCGASVHKPRILNVATTVNCHSCGVALIVDRTGARLKEVTILTREGPQQEEEPYRRRRPHFPDFGLGGGVVAGVVILSVVVFVVVLVYVIVAVAAGALPSHVTTTLSPIPAVSTTTSTTTIAETTFCYTSSTFTTVTTSIQGIGQVQEILNQPLVVCQSNSPAGLLVSGNFFQALTNLFGGNSFSLFFVIFTGIIMFWLLSRTVRGY